LAAVVEGIQQPIKREKPKKVSSIRQHMQEIVKRKIKIVTNAGGMNPEGCRAAMERIAKVETG
jgi:succinate dehydrogenase/fumarate reductase flavoprotein subunit